MLSGEPAKFTRNRRSASASPGGAELPNQRDHLGGLKSREVDIMLNAKCLAHGNALVRGAQPVTRPSRRRFHRRTPNFTQR